MLMTWMVQNGTMKQNEVTAQNNLDPRESRILCSWRKETKRDKIGYITLWMQGENDSCELFWKCMKIQ